MKEVKDGEATVNGSLAPSSFPSVRSSAGVQLCSLGGNWAPLLAAITPLNQGCNPITMQSSMRAPVPQLTELTEDVRKSSDEIWQNSGDLLSPSLSLPLSTLFFLTEWWIDMINFVGIPPVWTGFPHYRASHSFSVFSWFLFALRIALHWRSVMQWVAFFFLSAHHFQRAMICL